jgi:hypothetical protein
MEDTMKKLALALLCLSACNQHLVHALTAPAPGPGIQQVTWGTNGVTIGGQICLQLDGGATTYNSDLVVMGGYIGQAESGAAFECVVTASAAEDSFVPQFSNDGVVYAPSAATAGLLDGGVADGGVPGYSVVATTPAAYSRLALAHLAAMNTAVCCTVNTVPR